METNVDGMVHEVSGVKHGEEVAIAKAIERVNEGDSKEQRTADAMTAGFNLFMLFWKAFRGLR